VGAEDYLNTMLAEPFERFIYQLGAFGTARKKKLKPLTGDLVPNPLSRDLSLELGEGQKHVEGQATHAGRGIERLGHQPVAAVSDGEICGCEAPRGWMGDRG
jgi:hypothetical protein